MVLGSHPPCCLRWGPSLAWNSAIRLEWCPASPSPWDLFISSPVLGLQACTTAPSFSCGFGGRSLCGASSQLFLLFRGNDTLFGDYTDFKKAIANGVANAFWSRYSGKGLTIKEVHPAVGKFCAHPAVGRFCAHPAEHRFSAHPAERRFSAVWGPFPKTPFPGLCSEGHMFEPSLRILPSQRTDRLIGTQGSRRESTSLLVTSLEMGWRGDGTETRRYIYPSGSSLHTAWHTSGQVAPNGCLQTFLPMASSKPSLWECSALGFWDLQTGAKSTPEVLGRGCAVTPSVLRLWLSPGPQSISWWADKLQLCCYLGWSEKKKDIRWLVCKKISLQFKAV